MGEGQTRPEGGESEIGSRLGRVVGSEREDEAHGPVAG